MTLLSALQPMLDRCTQLGVPLWLCTEGRPPQLLDPHRWQPLDGWLQTPDLAHLLAESVPLVSKSPAPQYVEIEPGCWMVGLPAAPDLQVPGIVVATIFSPEAVTILGPLPENTAPSRAVLRKLTRHRPVTLDQLAAVTGWLFDDLRQTSSQRAAIHTFSGQLAMTYEQNSLLYRMTGAMNWVEEPKTFFRGLCDRLRETLSLEWVAIRLWDPPHFGLQDIHDQISSGATPVDFDTLAGKLTDTVMNQKELDATVCTIESTTLIVGPVTCDEIPVGVLLAGGPKSADAEVGSDSLQLFQAATGFLGAFLHTASLYEQQRKTIVGVVQALSAAVDAKSMERHGHSARVATLASQLARAVGLSEHEVERVRLAGLLHDIGKIGLPDSLLQQPGPLSESQKQTACTHPQIACDILKKIESLQDVLPAILHHHERWDGKGYPKGLKGQDIPQLARIIAVAETYERLSRDGSDRASVLQQIESMSGAQLEPELVEALLKLDHAEGDGHVGSGLAA